MPSLEDSRRQVKESLQVEEDHEAILASLQHEIDRHNALKDDLQDRSSRRRRSISPYSPAYSSVRSTKFRFKNSSRGSEDERIKHHHRDENDREHRPRRKRRKEKHSTRWDNEETLGTGETAHPFPREPAEPEAVSTDAFRTSLFDALADDEGAAAYWENVYSQPIHVYPRPEVHDSQTGKLEQMGDEEYAQYVKEKMWERKNPEVVFERKQKEKERKLAEEEKARRREAFVRRKERMAWERSQTSQGRMRGEDDSDGSNDQKSFYEDEIEGEMNFNSGKSRRSGQKATESEYTTAWTSYLKAWQALLANRSVAEDASPALSIPWPVLLGKPVLKVNIEAFMRRAPTDDDQGRLRTLKAERVRWHPDKIQQRFGGKVDEGTMKLVTGVFQVIDGMLEMERQRTTK